MSTKAHVASMKSNLWKLSLIQGIWRFMLIIPIIVLFYQENGLSLGQVFLLQAIFSIAVVVLEVPSGYFADILGRKTAIVAGGVCWFLGMLVYTVSYSFEVFLIAEILMGFAISFISGADSAFLYDSLLQLKKEKDFQKYEGRLHMISNMSDAIGGMLGGLLAVISLRTPVYAQAALAIFPLLIALTLKEPPRHKLDASAGKLKEILKIVKYSIHGHAEIKWLIIYAAVVNTSTLILVWFLQPYMLEVGIPIILFGFVWAIYRGSVGLFSGVSHRIEKFFGRKVTLISLIILSSLTYALLALVNVVWAVVFILIHSLVHGLAIPVLKDYVNKLVSSDIRATVLSTKSLVGRLLFVIVGPILGYVSDVYDLQTTFYAMAVSFLTMGLLSLFFLRKHKAL